MSWLLDTNSCINLMKLREPITSRVRDLGPAALAVSTITLAELWFGAAKSHRPVRTRNDQDAFLAPFRIVDFDAAAADRYAALKGHLVAKGQPIGDRDLMIAAIAVASRMAVVTSNTGEFARVPGLAVEDWMARAP